MNDRFAERFSGRTASPGFSGVNSFTDRELEIYTLIGKGNCTKKISQLLKVSPKTVNSHRSNIKQKLHLNTLEELICHAANSAALAEQ